MKQKKRRRLKLEHILLFFAVAMLIGIAVGQFANQAADDYIDEVDRRIEAYER